MIAIEVKRSRGSLTLLFLTAALLVAAGMFLGARFLSSPAFVGPEASTWPLRGEVTPDESKMTIASLPSGRKEKLPRVRAHLMQQAIKAGDFRTASMISEDTQALSRAKIWSDYPFKDFIKSVADLTDPAFGRQLSAWVDLAPLSPTPRLMRAQYYLDLAWQVRGKRFNYETDKGAQAAFNSILKKGLDDVRFALTLDPHSAYGLALQVELLRGFGASTEIQNALNQAVAVYPSFIPTYYMALSTLQPKWGGSVDQMYAFVSQYSSNAPAGSPLKLLTLGLYVYLLDVAAVDCMHQQDAAYATCFATSMRQNVRPGLEENIAAALDEFGASNAYETNQAVFDLIGAMIEEGGGAAYAGQILQMAANSYHSDPRLNEDKDVKNSYIIDELVAKSWLNKGFYDNAITKYKEAVSHTEDASFPTPEQKDVALAGIYETLMETYSKDNRLADMAASAQAALQLDENASSRLYLCFGYHLMTKYSEAVRECSKILSDPENGLSAYYWRGLSYKELHDGENAIPDFMKVASSQNGHRAGAVIELSMIYFGRNDNKAALGVLNKYPFVYDNNLTDKDDVAVAFNNRCYAYMELGDYQKALDDCNASLANGSIPDAFKKKQELIAKLSH